ncbi:MAG: S8 family serine peptidase [Flavobacterium sp.]
MKFYYIFLFSSTLLFSQTREQLVPVLKETDTQALYQLSAEFNDEFQLRNLRILSYLNSNPHQSRKFIEKDVEFEIFDVVDNTPIYSETHNRGAALTARANRIYNGGPLGLNVQGQGMTAHIWDGGVARSTHNEFPNNKVMNMDFSTSPSFHATHVIGTVVAQGFQTNLRGVAFDASAKSFDWNNDFSQMSTEAANGMLVSNHSYWSGASSNAWMFGAYDARARQLDQITFVAPFYLFVGSAGNDRNDFSSTTIGPYLIQKGGYNLIKGMHNAKNSLTVGAVDQVNSYTGPPSVTMSAFSSWGPTDDGRIKPDIVTKGTNVRSTSSTSDTADAISQGTSMASPGVTGVAILMQQHHFALKNQFMRAATLKGLLLHTADEAGFWPGPDYMFGWGLINAEKGAELISSTANNITLMEENTLQNGASYNVDVFATGFEPLVVSLSWTERAGTANNGANDPTNLALVNDLDVRVIGNNETYFPWTLDPQNPSLAAFRNADNFRDNYEQIQVDTPVAGTYTIQVTHKGSLVSGQQNYSLLVSGINQTLSTNSFSASDFTIYPNPTRNSFNLLTPNNSEDKTLEIYDIQGRVVLTRMISSTQNEIVTQGLPSGVYLVKVSASNGSETKKLVIQ